MSRQPQPNLISHHSLPIQHYQSQQANTCNNTIVIIRPDDLSQVIKFVEDMCLSNFEAFSGSEANLIVDCFRNVSLIL
jgi:hypothetical protein